VVYYMRACRKKVKQLHQYNWYTPDPTDA
jgi:hypothetical protein